MTSSDPTSAPKLQRTTFATSRGRFPDHMFNKILYLEKTGLAPLFADAQLGERFDLAVAHGNGQPVEATRALFERANDGEYQLFVLHDTDSYGYSVSISEEIQRMPDYEVDDIDLGLTVDDAIACGLTLEGFTRCKALPEWMPERVNTVQREWFERLTHSSRGKRQWSCQRVELNALSVPELIGFIEGGLARDGAASKVLPPEDVIAGSARGSAYRSMHELVRSWPPCWTPSRSPTGSLNSSRTRARPGDRGGHPRHQPSRSLAPPCPD